MQCPKCNTEMARKGFTEYGRVRFQCPACHHQEFPLPDEVLYPFDDDDTQEIDPIHDGD